MTKIELPPIGLGTMVANSRKAGQALAEGINIGFRFLDTAQMYLNEKTVGTAIKESGIPRDELTIATKLWISNFKPKRVIKSTNRSLKRLGIDIIDIMYIHWPYNFKNIDKTLKTLSKLVDEGKIKHIAVSNFTPMLIDKALTFIDKPIVANQVEMHPWLQQRELLDYLNSKDMHLVAYFPLLHGRFMEIPEVNHLAEKYNVNGAQVCLAWSMNKGAIPIPKSANVSHLKDNFAATKLKLKKEDIQLIDDIKIEKRMLKLPLLASE
ncbi:MAG: aldo/keto reductase [Asgard group archaeon]|nr:aldo/keto reductase [Asgard group archaeon]